MACQWMSERGSLRSREVSRSRENLRLAEGRCGLDLAGTSTYKMSLDIALRRKASIAMADALYARESIADALCVSCNHDARAVCAMPHHMPLWRGSQTRRARVRSSRWCTRGGCERAWTGPSRSTKLCRVHAHAPSALPPEDGRSIGPRPCGAGRSVGEFEQRARTGADRRRLATHAACAVHAGAMRGVYSARCMHAGNPRSADADAGAEEEDTAWLISRLPGWCGGGLRPRGRHAIQSKTDRRAAPRQCGYRWAVCAMRYVCGAREVDARGDPWAAAGVSGESSTAAGCVHACEGAHARSPADIAPTSVRGRAPRGPG